MHPGSQIEQIHLCREPIDFRKSIDGLSVLVEQTLELNPFCSALYVFTHQQRNVSAPQTIDFPDSRSGLYPTFNALLSFPVILYWFSPVTH